MEERLEILLEDSLKKLTKADLVGALAGFPLDVVKLMLVRQAEQGNTPDVEKFKRKADLYKNQGGFSWSDTQEGVSFWSSIFNGRNFQNYYALYGSPSVEKEAIKEDTQNEEVDNREEAAKVWAVIPKEVSKVGDTEKITEGFKFGERGIVKGKSKSMIVNFICEIPELGKYKYGVISSSSFKELESRGEDAESFRLNITFYDNFTPSPSPIYLTLQDISDGKGVGVDPSLIVIVEDKK